MTDQEATQAVEVAACPDDHRVMVFSEAVDPETMAGAAHYVQREYGFTGYRIATEQATLRGHGFFTVRHTYGQSL